MHIVGHDRLVGCSERDIFDALIHFKEEFLNIPLTEPGLAQKIQAIRDIFAGIKYPKRNMASN